MHVRRFFNFHCRSTYWASSVVLALLLSAASPALLAQAVNGSIIGTVTDATGAVVSGAQVTITLTGQDAQHTTVTNDSGNYTETCPPVLTRFQFPRPASRRRRWRTSFSTRTLPSGLTYHSPREAQRRP
jgi:hypothetical protein